MAENTLSSVTKALCFCKSSRLCVDKETLPFANKGALNLSQGVQAVSLGTACHTDSMCSVHAVASEPRLQGNIQCSMDMGCHKHFGFFICLTSN